MKHNYVSCDCCGKVINTNGLMTYKEMTFEDKAEIVIAQLRKDRDRLADALDKIRAEIEQLPTKTRTNWDGCCPDIDYPEIEYVDVDKNKLLGIIDKYKTESEDKKCDYGIGK